MADRTLNDLLKIRHLSAIEAMAALAEAVAREEVAFAAEISATNEILAEVSAAAAARTEDAAMDALATWLPRARRCQYDAQERRRGAEVATSQLRAALAATRTAEATVMSIIEKRRNDKKAEDLSRTQSSLLEKILRTTRD